MLLKQSLDWLGRKWTFLFRVVPDRVVLQGGFGNRCHDGRYVLFLDYDETPLEWIDEEIVLLQTLFRLGNAYVFATKHGFHVVFLEKHLLLDIIDMMKVTSCDAQYKDIPLYYGRRVWILRTTNKRNEKICYVGVKKHVCNYERSLAHKAYLQTFFDIPDEDFVGGGTFDEYRSLTVGYYRVSNHKN